MRRALAVLIVLGGFVIACQVIAGFERVADTDTPPDVVAEPPPPPPKPADPCRHAVPPPLPEVDDDPARFVGDATAGEKSGVLYFALRTVNFQAPPGAPPIGLDLDGVCTCTSGPSAAHDGGPSCSLEAGPKPCDADGGVDNALIGVVTQFAGLVDIDKQANINTRIAKGQQNVMLIITKYNGLANDKDIGIGVFVTEGIIDDRDDAGMGGTPPACPTSRSADGFWSPGWCGYDRWSVSTESVLTSGPKFNPKLQTAGYVTNYTFVAKFDGFAEVPFASYHLNLGQPIAMGRLVPLDANQQPIARTNDPSAAVPFWRIEDGVIGGRVPTTEILAALGTFVLPGGSDGGAQKHLCTSPIFEALLKPAVCPAVDVNRTANLDFDPRASCDAVSTAISFRADPASVGQFVSPRLDSNECYPTADGLRPQGVGNGVTYTCP